MSVTDAVHAAIVGAGLIGQVHSLMLRRIADCTAGSVRVTAVADSNLEAARRLASRWPGASAGGSAEELLSDDSIDAVWICTPTALHRDQCIAAARAGKHVFCEKPLAMTAGEAIAMGEEIRKAGVMSQVGLVLRFSPTFTVIREMTAEDGAGRMLAVMMRDDQDFPVRGVHNSAWRNDPSLTAGGTLIEHSVHDFDLMRWMFGPIARVYCRTRNLNGASGVEDFGATEIEFAAGFHGQLTSVWHRMIGRPSNRRMEVFSEDLFVACDHDVAGPIVVQRGDSPREETMSEEQVMGRFSEILLARRPYLSAFRGLFAVPYALEDASFIAALRGECGVDPGFEEGIKAQQLVEAAYRSSAEGRPTGVES
jgi:predicted dehydrogenase